MVGSEPPVGGSGAGEKPPSGHGVYLLHLVDEIAPETSVDVSECVVVVE